MLLGEVVFVGDPTFLEQNSIMHMYAGTTPNAVQDFLSIDSSQIETYPILSRA